MCVCVCIHIYLCVCVGVCTYRHINHLFLLSLSVCTQVHASLSLSLFLYVYIRRCTHVPAAQAGVSSSPVPRLKQKDPPRSKRGAGMATRPSPPSVLPPELSASTVLHQTPGPQMFTDAPRRKILLEVVQTNSAQKEIQSKR